MVILPKLSILCLHHRLLQEVDPMVPPPSSREGMASSRIQPQIRNRTGTPPVVVLVSFNIFLIHFRLIFWKILSTCVFVVQVPPLVMEQIHLETAIASQVMVAVVMAAMGTMTVVAVTMAVDIMLVELVTMVAAIVGVPTMAVEIEEEVAMAVGIVVVAAMEEVTDQATIEMGGVEMEDMGQYIYCLVS